MPALSDATAEGYFRQARQELVQRKTFDALSHINQALAIDGKNPRYCYLKANILYADEEDEQALPLIENCLRLDPGYANAWGLKAEILNGLRKHKEALVANERAVQLHPCLETWRSRAKSLFYLGEFARAEKDLDQAIKAEPGSLVTRGRRIEVATRSKHWSKVVEDATFLLGKGKPDSLGHFELLLSRADAYINSKQYNKAIADYKTGLAIAPDYRGFHAGLINVYTLTGNLAAARLEKRELEKVDKDITPKLE